MNPSEQLALVVANQAAVNRCWPNRDPIGAFERWTGRTARDFKSWASSKRAERWIGQAGRSRDLRAEHAFPWNPMRVVVRSPLPAAQLIPEIRRAVSRSTRRCPYTTRSR